MESSKTVDPKQRWMSACPACGGDPARHGSFRVASVNLSSGGELPATIENLVDQHRWLDAMPVQQWRAEDLVREYWAVSCPVRSRVSLAVVMRYPDLWDDDRIERMEVLDETESVRLAGLVGTRWLDL
jgi:hypothetical protein